MDPELKKAYEFAVKGVVAKITLVMAVLSTVRFVVDLYELPLGQLLANILKTYQVVFHTCVDVLLIWLPYSLPAWGKDVFIIYFTFAFVVARVVYRQAEIDFKHPWIVLHNFRNSARRYWLAQAPKLAKAVLFWPMDAWELLRKPFLVVPSGGHGPGSLCLYQERPDRKFSHQYMGNARLMMALRLLAIISGAVVVMLFNYVFSI